MSWYSTGFDGISKEEQRLASLSGPRRFFIPQGGSKELVVVDSDPATIHEHNAKLNGTWNNHHTCCGEGCESCRILTPRSKAFTGYLTCVDCSEFVDRKGNSHQYEVKLLGGKLGTMKIWRRKKEQRERDGLTFEGRWRVHRDGDKAPAVGNDWEYVDEIKDPSKLFEVANYQGKKLSELWDRADSNAESYELLDRTFQLQKGDDGKLVRRVVPFNYMKVLEPLSPEMIREMLSGVDKGEALGDNDKDSGPREDPVPF